MGKIVMKKRHVMGGYRYHKCTECGNEDVVEKPIRSEKGIDMPYCGKCGMIVFDQMQDYCGWCGTKFEKD